MMQTGVRGRNEREVGDVEGLNDSLQHLTGIQVLGDRYKVGGFGFYGVRVRSETRNHQPVTGNPKPGFRRPDRVTQ
jgi:hypothetical protein